MEVSSPNRPIEKRVQPGKSRHEDGTRKYPRVEIISTQEATGRQHVQRATTPLEGPAPPDFHAASTPIASERCGYPSKKPADTPQWVKTPAGRETAVLDACEQANVETEMVVERPPPRPALRPGSRDCECTDCGLFFGSPTAFDLHRIGHPDARRCLSPAELTLMGMEQNGRGMWVRPHHRPRAAAQQRPADRRSPPPDGTVMGGHRA